MEHGDDEELVAAGLVDHDKPEAVHECAAYPAVNHWRSQRELFEKGEGALERRTKGRPEAKPFSFKVAGQPQTPDPSARAVCGHQHFVCEEL